MATKFQPHRTWRYWLYSRPVALILLLLVIGLGRVVYLTWQKEQRADEARQAVLKQMVAAEERHDQLQADLESLETERGVEERIRSQFSVAKPGEQVVSVVLPPTATTTEAAPSFPWYQPILDLFN